MSLNFETVDKKNFECLKFPNGELYFGQTCYIKGESQIVELKDNEVSEEEKAKVKKVRHGAGIQFYTPANQEEFVSKYEGYWHLNKRHGDGKCLYPDKSEYEGKYCNDLFDEFGKYQWANGDKFEGNWNLGKLDGAGRFIHNDGHVLEGIFKNNYFQYGLNIFLNPFLNEKEMKEFLKIRKDIVKIKEKNHNIKHFMFEKVTDFTNIQEFIKKSVSNNRIPMILSSKQLLLTKDEFVAKFKEISQKNIHEFSLRDIEFELKSKESCEDYLNETKQALSNVLVKGESFVINIDETEQPYEEIHDPDFKQFYSATHFPSQIWHLQQLKKPEVFERILAGTMHKSVTKISADFQIIAWSKFRIDQILDVGKVMQKFERRFGSIIPTQKIDLALVCEPEKPPVTNMSSMEKIVEVECQKESPSPKKKN